MRKKIPVPLLLVGLIAIIFVGLVRFLPWQLSLSLVLFTFMFLLYDQSTSIVLAKCFRKTGNSIRGWYTKRFGNAHSFYLFLFSILNIAIAVSNSSKTEFSLISLIFWIFSIASLIAAGCLSRPKAAKNSVFGRIKSAFRQKKCGKSVVDFYGFTAPLY